MGLVSNVDAASSKHFMIIDTYHLVIGYMGALLQFLGIDPTATGNTADPSSATEATKRPIARLFLRSVLMCKVRAALPNAP